MSSILLLVLNVGLAAAVYLLLVRRIDRRLEPGRVVDSIRSEIDSIIVELNQTTDRNIGLIEDRVNRLNATLEQADRRLAVLKREVESRSSSTERYNDILTRSARSRQAQQPPAPGENNPGAADPRPADSGPAAPRPTEAGPADSRPADSVPGARQPAESGPGAPQPASRSRAERRKEIIELHRKGIASNIIANRTGSTVGEVELIISLADKTE